MSHTLDSIQQWFGDLPHNIAEMSIHLMSWIYDLSATLILRTPLWIFDNSWFENTTYMFSMLSIGIVSVLTIVESMKRMISGMRGRQRKQPMEVKDIFKRWFIVAGVTTAVPFIFQKSFQLLNALSGFLISLGANTMNNVAVPQTVSLIDVVTLTVFDIVLISTVIPVLWKNGRRFFDMMVLGVTAPLALTAWIFDPYRKYFDQWWERLKKLSLVQIYYSVFLLILGWFIFGVPTPSQFTGLIVKLLVVIGGFARMANPPRFVTSRIDTADGDAGDLVDTKSTTDKVKRNFKDSATILAKPQNAFKVIKDRVKDGGTEKVKGNPKAKTRTERLHGKANTKKAPTKPRRK